MEQQSQTETQIIIEKIKTGEIKFPLIRERIDDPRKLFEKLQKYIPTVSYKNFRYRNIQWKDPNYEKIKYKEKHYVSFLTQPKDYEEIDRLVDYFNEIPRITAKRIDKNYSLLEAWSNEDTLKKWITNQTIKNPQFVFSSYEWREELWKRSLECNAFKSTLAKSVYYSFKAKRILDFSAGWGDRLLAAIAHKAERYLGFDPNISLKQGHTEIIETFSPKQQEKPESELQEDPPSYEIRVEPFETAIIDKTEYFDLVFTSPPYFNFEIYTNDETQSIQRYPTHQEWIVKFLFRSLYKSWSLLQENGNMIIHLSDIYRSHYVESMTLFVLGWCPNSRFDGSIASIGDSFKPRPMWIYHKETSTTATTITSTAARKCMQQNYPEIYQKLSDFLPFIISE
jgi:16S rRNA G966 N2-methylase RsmD